MKHSQHSVDMDIEKGPTMSQVDDSEDGIHEFGSRSDHIDHVQIDKDENNDPNESQKEGDATKKRREKTGEKGRGGRGVRTAAGEEDGSIYADLEDLSYTERIRFWWRVGKRKLVNPTLQGIGVVTWMFLTVFGAAMEVRQLSSNALACEDDVGNSSPSEQTQDETGGGYQTAFTFSYSSACSAQQPYSPAFKAMHVVGGSLGLMHVLVYASQLVYHLIFLCNGVVFLLQDHLKVMIWVPSATGLLYMYQYLTYNVFFCSYSTGDFCRNPPGEYPTVRGVYMSLLVFGAVTTVVYLTLAAIFAWIFSTRRMHTWKRITGVEDTLMLTPKLQEAFETRNALRRTYQVHDFIQKWGNRSDDDILEELPIKSARVTRAILTEIKEMLDISRGSSRSSLRERDETRQKREKIEERELQENPFNKRPGPTPAESSAPSGWVSREEFGEYARLNGVVFSCDRDRLWGVLTNGQDLSSISHEDIEALMYELFFDRKQLANAIRTDQRVINFMLRYALATLYPACFIITAKIFGYADAFGRGIDLFKTYAVIVSYIYSNILTNVHFIMLMFSHRPFEIGDVISVDGDTYEVDTFNSSHTVLSGSTARIISNKAFLDTSIFNLTSNSVSESFDIGVPFNSTYGDEDLARALRAYMDANPRDIRSVRVGWVAATDRTKTLRVNWRYKFRIFDRSRLNMTRTRLLNHLVRNCNPDIIRAAFVEEIAGGGGLNELPGVSQSAERMWEETKKTV